MKYLLPLLLLTGCMCVINDAPKAPYPVELSGGIKGVYVECGDDLECMRNTVGVCKDGFWQASTITSLSTPRYQKGIVIVCGKPPSQQ